jgi:hypothetical protein
MASQDFHVNGPTKIKIGFGKAVAGSSMTELGYTDNEDLVRIQVRDHVRTFTRNDTGDMIAEAVMSGSTATVDMTFVSWDDTQFWTMLKKHRQGTVNQPAVADEGKFATVGGVVVDGDERVLTLEIVPTRVGETSYKFPSVMITAGPEYVDLGNTVKRIAMSFTSIVTVSENLTNPMMVTSTTA